MAQDDESDSEPFTPGPVAKAMMVAESQPPIKKTFGIWYLDSCAFRYLCNDKNLFKNLRLMCINFVTAASQVIQTEQVGTVLLPLKGGRIDLQNVVLATKCDSNLISLGQLQENGISFYDNPISMTLMKDGEIIEQAKKSWNLFVLDLGTSRKAMWVSHTISTCFANNTSSPAYQSLELRGRGWPTYLVSKNRKIRIWHCRLEHASNARVIRASTLVNSIDLQQAKYDLSEVFIDSEESKHDTDEDNNSDK